jgi:RHS repeat-associated protein
MEAMAGGATTDLYYSAAWQVLEERIAGTPTAQYVWSPVYVDALVERDRDANGQSSDGLEERLYAQQDANYNITALVDANGTVVERYVEDPYGKVTVLAANWADRGTTLFTWLYLHQGGRFENVSATYHFSYRDLSSALGRWLQRDPVEHQSGDTNFYRYEQDSPTNSLDYSGLICLASAFAPFWFGPVAYHYCGQEEITIGKDIIDALVKARKAAEDSGRIGFRIEYGGSIIWPAQGGLEVQEPVKGESGYYHPGRGKLPNLDKGEFLHGIYHVHPTNALEGPLPFSAQDIFSLASGANASKNLAQLRHNTSYLVAGKNIYILQVCDRDRAQKCNDPGICLAPQSVCTGILHKLSG